MNIELHSAEIIQTQEQQYALVIDLDLAYVGGGQGLVNY